jgi:hypothetical protein
MSLQKARNQLASIFVLPPEVLSKIFIFIRDSPFNPYMLQYPTCWIRTVGHICHQWRKVALNCATLWSAPIFTNPELAQEMIRRSKRAELTIYLPNGSWTPRVLNEIEDAMTQIFRIRVLRLSYTSHYDGLRKLFATFSQPAPHLEQLALTNGKSFSHFSHRYLPDDAFADAPRLRSIELAHLHFSWTHPIFKHNLTTLKVDNHHIPDTSTLSQLLEALGHMPDLQTLSLVQCIPSHTTVNGNEPTLNFPALRYLEIDSSCDNCTQFLRCIKYPPHTLIKLACTSLTKVDDYTNVFARIGEGLHKPSAPSTSQVFRSAKIWRGSDDEMGIFFYNQPITVIRPGFFAYGTQQNPDVDLRLVSSENSGLSFNHVLRELYRLIDLKHLEALELEWPPSNHGIESIRETIGKLPNLKLLCVTTYGSQVIDAIGHSSDPDPTTERGRGKARGQKYQWRPPPVTVFPALKTLCLECVDFYGTRASGRAANLINTLIHRSNINAPIEELQLDECAGVRIEQKRLLGELVVDLVVDGDTIDVLGLDSEDEMDSDDEEGDWGEMDEYDDYFDDDDMYDYGYGHDLLGEVGWYPSF